ncbi:hypothetical protein PSTAB_2125 [Stutzerimonas stutzeri]|uniref:Uncharacterized protein n=1 Tax=Stutzerimonas stutzeri (strain ATCC 17588 / DSM 5190 / CCUG 11256 / JCM 5965 / LMG 11199 / NBRC 14165 / NCIMB 11358 / Stanier 221) TaxID=96563 RepID=F8GZE5_STUS2|nr:hypothetical protein PSTAB_2125 [Stutzerimonas stutzeri]AKN27055.1 hypothetical protein AB691_2160 [Stutzerimonas stutzeri]GBC56839.1 hypothetical protein PSNTI_23130 [Stutzerimonas stutzeri]
MSFRRPPQLLTPSRQHTDGPLAEPVGAIQTNVRIIVDTPERCPYPREKTVPAGAAAWAVST